MLELGHMLDLAEVITVSALFRQESRGAHSREDFPARNDTDFLVHTLVRPDEIVRPAGHLDQARHHHPLPAAREEILT